MAELCQIFWDAEEVVKKISKAEGEIQQLEKDIIKRKAVIANPVPEDSKKKHTIGKHEQEAMDKENNRFIAERSAARKGAYRAVKGPGVAVSIISLLIVAGLLYLSKPILAIIIGGAYAILTIMGFAAYAGLQKSAPICKTYRTFAILWTIASFLGAYASVLLIQMGKMDILHALAFGAGLGASALASLINAVLISKGLKVHATAFNEKDFYDRSALVAEARKLDAEEEAKAEADLAAKIVKQNKAKIKENEAKIAELKASLPALNKELDSIIVLPPKYRDLNGLARLTGYYLSYKQEYGNDPTDLDQYISYVEWKVKEREWERERENERVRREVAKSIANTIYEANRRNEEDMRRRQVERDLSAARKELEELNKTLDKLK